MIFKVFRNFNFYESFENAILQQSEKSQCIHEFFHNSQFKIATQTRRNFEHSLRPHFVAFYPFPPQAFGLLTSFCSTHKNSRGTPQAPAFFRPGKSVLKYLAEIPIT